MSDCVKCRREIPDGAVFCPWCGLRQARAPQNPKRRGNGQGSVYKRSNGHYIAVVSWWEGTRLRRKTKTFLTKKDAVNALPSLMKERQVKTTFTVQDLYDQYISGRDYAALSDSQKEKLGIAWKRWEPLAGRDISTLTVDDLQQHIDNTVSTYYPARDMSVILSHLYKIAIKKEIVPLNKTEYIDLPDAPTPKIQCWTADEMQAMWQDYAQNPFTGYVLIMCYAGLRYGELSSILLEDIHLNDGYMIGGIKTEAGIDREIPLPSKIRPVIEKVLTIGSHKRKLLEMNDDNFYRAYWQMVERTGIRQLPPQTCRHYYFSQMTAAGVQPGVIVKTGGHASYSTTLKNYVRIPLADKIAAVEKIP